MNRSSPILSSLASGIPAVRDLLIQRHGREMYLVGGALRDLLLSRPVADLDFATPEDPSSFAQEFAKCVGGRWFFLDELRRQSRVVLKAPESIFTFDFSPYRAPGLKEDLRLRDFTINALALPLHEGDNASLFDPWGGERDLADKLLRGCSPGVFRDDPLRILKGVRHAAVLRFTVEPETVQWMRSSVPMLSRVAPERIRSELSSIFSARPVAPALHRMSSLGLLGILFPNQGGSLEDAIRRTERIEKVLKSLACEDEERTYLEEEVEGGLSRAAILKCVAFCEGLEVSMNDFAARWKFSRRTVGLFSALLGPVLEMGTHLFHLSPGRGRALGAAELGRHPGEALIFLALNCPGPPEEAAAQVRPVLRDYRRHAVGEKIPDLLSGEEVQAILGIALGPKVGEILRILRQEEREGRIRTPGEGRKFLESLKKK